MTRPRRAHRRAAARAARAALAAPTAPATPAAPATSGASGAPAALALVAVVLAVVIAACGAATSSTPALTSPASAEPAASMPAASPPGSGAVELTVFAAASLREAFGAVEDAYEAAVPGVSLVFSFDASSTLRAQVEQGAPADVFAAADMASPQALVAAGLTLGEPVPFAGNRLALVVAATNPAGITTPADLARPGIRLVNAGPEVPITTYAAELLSSLAGLPGYPPRYVAAVAANVVSREDNVRAVLTKIQLGEGDAGIVYATDAIAGGEAVQSIPIPGAVNPVATYAAVVPSGTPNPAVAAAFVGWLGGPGGMAVLARFGFVPPAR